MILQKRVRIVLPVRLYKTSVAGPSSEMVCTWDVSASGARLTGMQGVYEVNEILRLERGKLRAKGRVAWTGKHGTPLAKQIGIQLCHGERPVWDVNLDELEEEYDSLGGSPADRPEIGIPSGTARAHVFAGSEYAQGELVKFSLRNCTVQLPAPVFPTQVPVQLLIAGDGLDLRLRGSIRRACEGYLTLDLEQVRRGDRMAVEYLYRLANA